MLDVKDIFVVLYLVLIKRRGAKRRTWDAVSRIMQTIEPKMPFSTVDTFWDGEKSALGQCRLSLHSAPTSLAYCINLIPLDEPNMIRFTSRAGSHPSITRAHLQLSWPYRRILASSPPGDMVSPSSPAPIP